MEPCELSLAICTRNRPDLFEKLLQRIAPETQRLGIELIIVDSASDSGAATRVATLSGSIGNARLIRLDIPGISIARNAALEAATTPWLAYLDDDELPPPDWADKALALCRRLPASCGACGGNMSPEWPVGFTVPNIGWRWRQYLSVVEQVGEFDQSAAPKFLIGHAVVRVAAVQAIGGFDNRLGRDGTSLLSGEEVLLVELMLAAGWQIWHSDQLQVLHMIEHERLTHSWVRKRAYWEGVTRARVLALADQERSEALYRDISRKAPLLRLLAAVAPRLMELDLRWAFATGVLAERQRFASAAA